MPFMCSFWPRITGMTKACLKKSRKYLIIVLLLTVFVLQPLMDIELESPSVGRVGFYNEGNSCFLNAACQVCVCY